MNRKKNVSLLLLSALLFSGCTPEGTTSLPSSEAPTSLETTSVTSEGPLLYPLVEFRAILPFEKPEGATIRIVGNFTAWDPFSGIALSHLKDNTYYVIHPFEESSVGSKISYKFVLIYDDQPPGTGFDNEEVDSAGLRMNNRELTLTAGKSRIDAKIGGFKGMGKGTVTRGELVKVVLDMPQFSDGRKRTIRIWLPDGYEAADKATKYPVLYMHDGQNLFDQNTSFGEEWQIDETIGTMMDKGYGGTIVVGIDNGPERLSEYTPSVFPVRKENEDLGITAKGDLYAAFVVNTVKPYIDQNFNTLTAKEHTGIGGSSMGGIISFFMALEYQHIFGYGLIFSSSFWVYEANAPTNLINEKITDPLNAPKLYLYHGNGEGSYTYLNTLANALSDKGVATTKYTTYLGLGRDHTERSWSLEFPRAYRWLVDFTG
ncbi:MAG: alpha/beta hydrolase-fold protein [Bacilli bacterium]